MVGVLHKVPYILKVLILSLLNLWSQGVELLERLILKVVTKPSGDIALLIGPRHSIGAVKNSHRLELLSSLANGGKLYLASSKQSLRQRLHKVEDTRSCLLVLAEGLIVHKEVNHITSLRSYPLSILICRERPLWPALIREAESDIVRELVVAEQQTQLIIYSIGIYKVWRLPAEDMTRALSKHSLKAHTLNRLSDIVRVDKLGVAECRRLNTKLLLKHLGVELNLLLELVYRVERRERVRVCLTEELYTARIGQLLKRLQYLGSVGLELLNSRASDRERALKRTLILLDKRQQQRIHRQVALAGHLLHNSPISEVVEVVVVVTHLEETIGLQTPGLVNLKIETNGFHISYFLFIYYTCR